MNELWDEITLEEGCTYFWQIGLRKIWISHRNDEWFTATELLPGSGDLPIIVAKVEDKPREIQWQRILCKTPSPVIRLRPATPEKAVVVTSEYPLTITPGNSGNFYVLFRCNISIQTGENFKHNLLELTTMDLSSSWFGEPDAGYPCYALKTMARRKISHEEIPSYKIICPVKIDNLSREVLDFSKISVQVIHLNIYRKGNQLWSNRVKISFHGSEKGSALKYAQTPPAKGGNENEFVLLTNHRESPKQNLLKRSLALIKNLTEMEDV